ncbi:MAG: FAD-dependent oxidoreductase [Sedimentisphaerales bacterium]|nr:FAD-dependent oxidoreductase [Sedimentisphaerales bacterium]
MRRRMQVSLTILFCCSLISPTGCSRPAERPRGTVAKETAGPAGDRFVLESARQIPVLHDIDVVVVGGASGAVAAAVAAAENGAKVFLAAPRPYLGEDLCGTYRLWLEPDEEPTSPLAMAMFAEPPAAARLRGSLPFYYQADTPSASPHKDSEPSSLLKDGKWHSAASQSVQYNGDVSLVADLGSGQLVTLATVMAYQRNGDFEVASIGVSASDDGQQWRQVAVVDNARLGDGAFENAAVALSTTIGQKVRYLRFAVKKTAGAKRVLLGEVLLTGPDDRVTASRVNRIPPTPMQVKRALDDALLDAGVPFLYGCYVTDVLHDESGRPAGIVMANRSGRQAIKARIIIDATPRATVARLAGASFEPYSPGTHLFKRIVVGGQVREEERARARKLPAPVYASDGRAFEAIEYTLAIPMSDGSFASFASAEQVARDRTWDAGQVDASETLFQVPPDGMRGKAQQCCEWPGAQKIDLDVFRPAGVEFVYVLGGCADVSDRAAEQMLRPLELMEVGTRIGEAAAAEARAMQPPRTVKIMMTNVRPVASGDVREEPAWMRIGARTPQIKTGKCAVPVLGEYDVVVVGGGTGGAPAGIAAARQGARTLVVEYLHGLGGIGTMGLIGKYYYGRRGGFTKELDQGLAQLGGEAEGKSGQGQAWNSQLKIEWYRRELRRAGADIWYGTLGCGAFVDGDRVKGVVVATPDGRGVVLAKAVIDATGSADVAAAAGASCSYIAGAHVAVQGTGLPPWEPGARYTNTDFDFIDDIDVTDTSYSFLAARKKFGGAYDLGQIIDSRERRQIVGDFCLSPMDVYLDRTFPDTVVRASSNFDSHGFTIHPIFLLRPPNRETMPCYVPYRCLLPRGIEGVLVTGLAVSAHRDVMPVIRMQADVQNQGYAAGLAAAMAAREGRALREIDIRQLQRQLAEKGNLPPEVLTHEDSFPLPKEQIEEAVTCVTNDLRDLEKIFAEPEQALPLLRDAYRSADMEKDKLTYAHILGVMGDPTGAETLAQAVAQRQWDEGWKYTGMGQYGASVSVVDSLIIALGRTRRDEALQPILSKVRQLGAEHALSHHRAVAEALEVLGKSAAAGPLAELLQKPGMAGHAFTDIETATREIPPSPTDNTTRECSLRELMLARALYRCGDYDSLGERILRQYAQDLRGHYARHALAILNERKR